MIWTSTKYVVIHFCKSAFHWLTEERENYTKVASQKYANCLLSDNWLNFQQRLHHPAWNPWNIFSIEIFCSQATTSLSQSSGICIGRNESSRLPYLAAISVSFAKYISRESPLEIQCWANNNLKEICRRNINMMKKFWRLK